MYPRLSGRKLDGNITSGAGSLFKSAQRKIRYINRQTVGGEIAVSTVKDDGDTDARAHRQIVVEFGKGERRAEIQVIAVDGFDAAL